MNKIPSEEIMYQLKMLLPMNSPGGREVEVVNYCFSFLRMCGFQANVDKYGNISAIRGAGPYILLNAHMDTLRPGDGRVLYDSEKGIIFREKLPSFGGGAIRGHNGVLGGDDKAGIAIILALAKLTDFPMKVLLTTMEEPPNASKGIGHFVFDSGGYTFFDDVTLAITIDRMGSRQIIPCYPFRTNVELLLPPPGTRKELCVRDSMLSKLIDLSTKTMPKPWKVSEGTMCDAGVILYFAPAINLSCGYHHPHSQDEYIKVSETRNTMDFVAQILLFEPNLRPLTPEFTHHRSEKVAKATVDLTADVQKAKQRALNSGHIETKKILELLIGETWYDQNANDSIGRTLRMLNVIVPHVIRHGQI